MTHSPRFDAEVEAAWVNRFEQNYGRVPEPEERAGLRRNHLEEETCEPTGEGAKAAEPQFP